LTVARFCADEHVSVNTFYYWIKQLGKLGGIYSTADQFSEVANRAEVWGVGSRTESIFSLMHGGVSWRPGLRGTCWQGWRRFPILAGVRDDAIL
jgi:hypothetical protein